MRISIYINYYWQQQPTGGLMGQDLIDPLGNFPYSTEEPGPFTQLQYSKHCTEYQYLVLVTSILLPLRAAWSILHIVLKQTQGQYTSAHVQPNKYPRKLKATARHKFFNAGRPSFWFMASSVKIMINATPIKTQLIRKAFSQDSPNFWRSEWVGFDIPLDT